MPVTTIPETIVVNVGDMLQRLTNNVLRSTTHRVVNPPPPFSEVPRYSIPFFLHPNSELLIESLEQLRDGGRPEHYPGADHGQRLPDAAANGIGLLPGK